MGITNDQLLNMIEVKKMDAEQICKKCKFSMGMLIRRYSVMTMNYRKFIDLPGLFPAEDQAELKNGITISAKKLESLESTFPVGTKFTIAIDKTKITLTAN